MPPTAKTSTTAATRATATAAVAAKPGRAANASGYRQVADALRDQITAGVLPPAAPLPSEAQLVAAYGVSRPTVRAAVASLVAEGLVVTLHGKGSFVRRADDRPSVTHPRQITVTTAGRTTGPTTSRTTGRTTGATAGGRGSRRKPDLFRDADTDDEKWQPVEPPATYRTNATPGVALALGLPEHAPVFVCDRLLADPAGRRLSHRSYVPFAVAADVPALETDPFRAPGDLYGVLSAAGHKLDWTETVRARMPSPDDAAALHIPTGTPMLVTRRTTRDDTGRILAHEETRISAEDTQLAYTIDARAASPAATA